MTEVKRFYNKISKRLGSKVVKEFIWIIFGQGISILGALVGIKVLTSLLIPAEYGKLALGMSVTTFIAVAGIGPLTGGIVRYFAPARQERNLPSYFIAVRELVGKVTFGMIIFSLISILIVLITGQREYLIFVLGALSVAFLDNVQNMINGIQNAARARSLVAFHSVLASWGKFIFAALLIIFIWDSSVMAIWGYSLGLFIVILSQIYFIRKKLIKNINIHEATRDKVRDFKTKIFSQSWPVALWGLLSSIYLISDRWSLELFSSTTNVGVYVALFQLGSFPIRIIVNNFTSLIVPIYYEKAGNALDKERLMNVYRLVAKTSLIAFFIFIIFIILTGIYQQNLIFYFLGKRDTYLTNSYILPWIALSASMTNLSNILCFGFKVSNKIRLMVKPFVLSTIIGIISVSSGAYFWGLNGVIVGITLESTIKIIWTSILFLNEYKKLKYARL